MTWSIPDIFLHGLSPEGPKRQHFHSHAKTNADQLLTIVSVDLEMGSEAFCSCSLKEHVSTLMSMHLGILICSVYIHYGYFEMG